MSLSKRQLLKLSALTAAASPLVGFASSEADKDTVAVTSPSFSKPLEDLTAGVEKISLQERLARVEKAQKLMRQFKIDALVLEPGSAMLYFTGISWWRSERLTAVIIPRQGDIAVVTPFFEEPSVRESMTFGDDVRTWNEHESPFALLAGVLKDRGIRNGRIGVEATVRYFVVQGIQKAIPTMAIISSEPVTRGCRMIKSAGEIALMKKANEITLAAYGHVYSQLALGMTPADVNGLMSSAQAQLGGQGIWTMALFGEASAYPHGSSKPHVIEEGQIVLMDCGCSVEGYQSDISRTFVFGEPNEEQQKIWNLVRKGQAIAFEAAKLGQHAGIVDDAVRKFYEQEGFGPNYALPGLSHRTGHGIGMDGHEPVNFVKGEQTQLSPGMCFSNEPGIYLPGKFGVRLEDCIYMTETGPAWFTEPPASLAQPLGKLG